MSIVTPGAGRLRHAYGSNGLSDHRLADAAALVADAGYDGLSLTLDHWHLDACGSDLQARATAAGAILADHGLDVVVETGGRFVLDPFAKHHPTLVSADGADRRIEFYDRAAQVAAIVGSPVLHLWSGIAPADEDPARTWQRLLDGVTATLAHARAAGVAVAFEPEPGMVVDCIEAFERMAAALGDPPDLGITLDVGHCRCLEPRSEADCIRRVADRLRHVQIEDMRRGVHHHLPFGEGEVDLPGALAALVEVGYDGLVSVELPRDGHRAHELVPHSIAALRSAEPAAQPVDDATGVATSPSTARDVQPADTLRRGAVHQPQEAR